MISLRNHPLFKTTQTVVVRVLGAGMAFLLAAFISREFGPGAAGRFYLSIAVSSLLSHFAVFGYGVALMRIGGRLTGTWRAPQLARAFSYLYIWCTGLAIAVMFVGAGIVALFGVGGISLANLSPVLTLSLIWPITILQIGAFALRGQGRPAISTMFELVLVPLVTLSAVLISSQIASVDTNFIMLTYWAASMMAAVACTVWVGPLLSRPAAGWLHGFQRARKFVGSQYGFGKDVFLNNSFNLIAAVAPFIILGIFETSYVVGLFNAANRFSGILTLFQFGILAVAAPMFSRLSAMTQRAELNLSVQRFVALMTLIATAQLIAMLVGGKWFLSFFGPEFVQAVVPLWVLSVFVCAGFAFGPVMTLLVMTGKEKRSRDINLFAAIASIILSLALIPSFGMLGCAVAMGLAGFGTRAAGAYYVWKDLGIVSLPTFRSAKALLSWRE